LTRGFPAAEEDLSCLLLAPFSIGLGMPPLCLGWVAASSGELLEWGISEALLAD